MENDGLPNAVVDDKNEAAGVSRVDDSDRQTTDDVDKYLLPDANATVHKEKLLELSKSILGALYSEDMWNCLVDIMNPDEEGNITVENFVHAFSLAYWTPESVAAMHNVLVTNPDIVSKLADWKDVLKNFGLDVTDSEVNAIIQQAQTRATALLSAELSKSAEYAVNDRVIMEVGRAYFKDLLLQDDEVHRKSSEIINSIRAKLSGLDIKNIGTGESGSIDDALVGAVEGADHPETPQFPAVQDKLEAEDPKDASGPVTTS